AVASALARPVGFISSSAATCAPSPQSLSGQGPGGDLILARLYVTASAPRGRRAATLLLFAAIAASAAAQPPADQRRTLAARQVEALGIRIEPAGGVQTATVARYPATEVSPGSPPTHVDA